MCLQLRSLGYPVVGVDEFYTFKKCPNCLLFVDAISFRRLYCPICARVCHRDCMLAHNIAHAALSLLKEQTRPAYLCPDVEQTARGKRPRLTSAKTEQPYREIVMYKYDHTSAPYSFAPYHLILLFSHNTLILVINPRLITLNKNTEQAISTSNNVLGPIFSCSEIVFSTNTLNW